MARFDSLNRSKKEKYEAMEGSLPPTPAASPPPPTEASSQTRNRPLELTSDPSLPPRTIPLRLPPCTSSASEKLEHAEKLAIRHGLGQDMPSGHARELLKTMKEALSKRDYNSWLDDTRENRVGAIDTDELDRRSDELYARSKIGGGGRDVYDLWRGKRNGRRSDDDGTSGTEDEAEASDVVESHDPEITPGQDAEGTEQLNNHPAQGSPGIGAALPLDGVQSGFVAATDTQQHLPDASHETTSRETSASATTPRTPLEVPPRPARRIRSGSESTASTTSTTSTASSQRRRLQGALRHSLDETTNAWSPQRARATATVCLAPPLSDKIGPVSNFQSLTTPTDAHGTEVGNIDIGLDDELVSPTATSAPMTMGRDVSLASNTPRSILRNGSMSASQRSGTSSFVETDLEAKLSAPAAPARSSTRTPGQSMISSLPSTTLKGASADENAAPSRGRSKRAQSPVTAQRSLSTAAASMKSAAQRSKSQRRAAFPEELRMSSGNARRPTAQIDSAIGNANQGTIGDAARRSHAQAGIDEIDWATGTVEDLPEEEALRDEAKDTRKDSGGADLDVVSAAHESEDDHDQGKNHDTSQHEADRESIFGDLEDMAPQYGAAQELASTGGISNDVDGVQSIPGDHIGMTSSRRIKQSTEDAGTGDNNSASNITHEGRADREQETDRTADVQGSPRTDKGKRRATSSEIAIQQYREEQQRCSARRLPEPVPSHVPDFIEKETEMDEEDSPPELVEDNGEDAEDEDMDQPSRPVFGPETRAQRHERHVQEQMLVDARYHERFSPPDSPERSPSPPRSPASTRRRLQDLQRFATRTTGSMRGGFDPR
ncbi:hypothetical protein LTR78_006732 [Recurvomyces mirabilis]|uniref:Uncharacterized protein n=1 Tax=Recurvomyces mirabilis TaxID=574656 RepID=A0AAE0WKQ4_9PEZI|nr:hypothetical protein LTR78_006732 [Recurvomyces mirabilis]KAK5151379.1 hypothetical protein LTS14_009222 [Recurvomyces mirabilis]